MKKGMLGLAAIILMGGALKAQTDTADNKKEVTIERRLNDGKPEKMIIIIDGDKVTVNGEEVKDWKGKLNGLNRLGNGDFNFDGLGESFTPQMRDMFKSFGPQMQNSLRGFTTSRGNKAMLGVNVEKNDQGAKITEVVKESAAEKAGLKTDDIITSINADKITDGDALVKTIGKYKPEEVVDITVLRSGKEKKFKATLGKNNAGVASNWNWNSDVMPPRAPNAVAPPRAFNFNNDDFSGFDIFNDRPKYGFGIKDNDNGDGAIITNVKEESSAAKAGLKENDVITEAAGETVKTTDDLKRLLAENRDKTEVSVKVLRNGKSQSFTLKVPKKIKTAEL